MTETREVTIDLSMKVTTCDLTLIKAVVDDRGWALRDEQSQSTEPTGYTLVQTTIVLPAGDVALFRSIAHYLRSVWSESAYLDTGRIKTSA